MSRQTIDHGRYVPALINFIGNKLTAGASNAYRREFGVGITEWRILSLLAVEESCTAQQICEYFDLDKGLMSRTTKSLVDNGAVTVIAKGAGSKRTVQLTKQGRALHDRIIKLALQRERVLLSCLSKPETDTLIELLQRLLDQTHDVNAVSPKFKKQTNAA
jgi:DNA-binding MarR family transcriptional regulator